MAESDSDAPPPPIWTSSDDDNVAPRLAGLESDDDSASELSGDIDEMYAKLYERTGRVPGAFSGEELFMANHQIPSYLYSDYDHYFVDPQYMDRDVHRERRHQMVGDLWRDEVDSNYEGPRTPNSIRSASPPRLMDMGIFDLEFSEPPLGIIGEDQTDDSDDSQDTDSDGDLSDTNSNISADDDDDSYESEKEVPNPPELPIVSEERLQKVWTLGDQSFSVFLCPITHDVMTDPVVCADGYTYERSAIARWFETSRKSPVTGQTLPHINMVPNQSVRTLLKTLIDMTDYSGNSLSTLDKTEKLGEENRKHATDAPPTIVSPEGNSASSSASIAAPSFGSTGAVAHTSRSNSVNQNSISGIAARDRRRRLVDSVSRANSLSATPFTSTLLTSADREDIIDFQIVLE